MTDERQNEIWAMLDADTQNDIKKAYSFKTFNREFNDGYNGALEDIFGKHNLTAQAEETCKGNGKSFTDSDECVKESTNSLQNSTDWNKYRLDLAKEIAVAMIMSHETSGSWSIAERAVARANEIIKRLKETEE